MRYVRLITLWMATILLSGGLSLLLSGWIFNATLGNRNILKSWITSSGIYDEFVDEVVSSSFSEVDGTNQSIDPVVLQTAANHAFPPGLLQASTETVLDGAYDWLDGSTETVEFTLDFTEAKSSYASELASQAEMNIEELPACSTSELATLDTIEPFSLTCAPPSFIYQSVIAELQQEILNSDDLLPDPVITASDIELPIGGNKKTIEDSLPYAPLIYQLLQAGVVISIAVIVISIAALVLLAHDKLTVLLRVSRSFLAAAITAGLMTGILFYVTQAEGTTSPASGTQFIERISEPLIGVIANDILGISRVFTAIYLLISIGCYVAYRVFNKRRLKHSPT